MRSSCLMMLVSLAACGGNGGGRTPPCGHAPAADGGAGPVDANGLTLYVMGEIVTCPSITLSVVGTNALRLGKTTELVAHASASDLDELAFHWKASAGKLGSKSGPNNTYRCAALGPQMITVRVVTEYDCEASIHVAIDCVK